MSEQTIVRETELWQYPTDTKIYFMFLLGSAMGKNVLVQPERWGEKSETVYTIPPESAKGVMLSKGKLISYTNENPDALYQPSMGRSYRARFSLDFKFFLAGNRMLVLTSDGQSASHVFGSTPTPAQVVIEAHRLNPHNLLYFETLVDNLYPEQTEREKMALLQAVGAQFGIIPYRKSKLLKANELVEFTEGAMNNPLVTVEPKGARGGAVIYTAPIGAKDVTDADEDEE